MLPTVKFGKKKALPHLKHSFTCLAPKNSYLSRRTYSDTSAELVVARVVLSFEHVQTLTTTPEQPVKCIRAAKEPSTMSQDHCQNLGQSKYRPNFVIR